MDIHDNIRMFSASSALNNALDAWTFSVTNLAAGRYDISGSEGTAGNIALVLATLINLLKAKGIIR